MNIDRQRSFVHKNPTSYSVNGVAKRIKKRGSKLLRDKFLPLKRWLGYYGHQVVIIKTFRKTFIKKISQQGWVMVERYISGPKGYEKADTVPVVVIDAKGKRGGPTF